MKDFRTLSVWQKSHTLTLKVYVITKSFPKEKMFGITSQLRRSISSIPAYLAEGCGRGSDKDFKRFVQIAMGSASESEYHLILCASLEYITKEKEAELLSDIQEIKKMLASLIKTLAD